MSLKVGRSIGRSLFGLKEAFAHLSTFFRNGWYFIYLFIFWHTTPVDVVCMVATLCTRFSGRQSRLSTEPSPHRCFQSSGEQVRLVCGRRPFKRPGSLMKLIDINKLHCRRDGKTTTAAAATTKKAAGFRFIRGNLSRARSPRKSRFLSTRSSCFSIALRLFVFPPLPSGNPDDHSNELCSPS